MKATGRRRILRRSPLVSKCRILEPQTILALLATPKHAASMANLAFYDRQRRRFSTRGVPRFLHSLDETLDGRLVLPRGSAGLLASAVAEAGSTLEIDDRRANGTLQQFRAHCDVARRPGRRRPR